MKLRLSPKKLSLQLIAFLAAVSGAILQTAIAVRAESFNLDRSSQRQLLVQAWSDLDVTELSLVDPFLSPQIQFGLEGKTQTIIEPIESKQQLLAQAWSDLDVAELSLADPLPSSATPSRADNNKLLQLTPLDRQQRQLIAQIWSFNPEQISLATFSDGNKNNLEPSSQASTTDSLLIAQSDRLQQQIAQVWSDVKAQDLSFASPETNFTLPSNRDRQLQPSPREPVINPPNRREIAARLALKQVQIISPAPGVILDKNQSDRITVRYPSTAAVQLKVNGTELDRSLIVNRQLDSKRDLVTQTWRSANLKQGENNLNVVATKDGVNSETNREVMVRDTSVVADATRVDDSTPNNPDSSDRAPDSTNSDAPTRPPGSDPSATPSAGKVKILTPSNNEVLDTIHSSVIIQYPQAASVILQLNGKSIDTSQVGRTEVNPATGLVTQTWYSVIFGSGANDLSILATTDGSTYEETSIEVIVPGKPQGLKVETVEAEIAADGNSTTEVKGGFVDKHGTIAPWNETITLNSSSGKFIGTDLEPDIPGFQVRPLDGEFNAVLQAGYDAKNVRIQAKTSKFESYTQVKFKTTLREKPLLTGFANVRFGARGTDFYDSLRDFLPLDEDNDYEFNSTSAAFISGSWGRWSYKGAFNSDRSINEDGDGESRLFQAQDSSESDYPVYGDSSTTEPTTPSTDSLYLRFQQSPRNEFAEPDYFMWGDYDTEEFNSTAQEFTGIARQLHGFKSNYNLGDFKLNAFYANNAEGFQRDAIAPDGTSGFYFFSRRLLVPGSEDIFIELTPLNDPGNIVSRQRLEQGTDYEVDYDRGTVLFNDPVLRTDIDEAGNVLARRIVATYQFESEANESNLIAGRASYFFDRDPDGASWLGTTFLNEDRGDQDFMLWGVDSQITLGNWGKIVGEYAESNNQTIFADATGSAYRFEGDVKVGESIQAKAFYRESSEGFANNATLSFVPGQTRYGSQIKAQVAEDTSLNLAYERQDNQGVAPRPLDELEEFLDSGIEPVPGTSLDNSLSTVTAGVEQRFGEADLGIALTWRDRTDRKSPNTFSGSSTQLQSRFSTPIANKLDLNLINDLTISNDTDAVFSDRLGVGLDWEFYDGLSLAFNQQWFTRGNLAGESLTSIGLEGEYEPWANATLTGRYSIANSVSGMSNIGAIGLQQKITVAPGLDLDLDYERTFSGLNENTSSTGRQFSQPVAVGQGASALSFDSGTTYGVGISYSDNPNYTASARWQQSNKANGNNTVISAEVTGKLSTALTSLFSYSQANSANQEFDIGTSRDLRLGLAYRHPKQDKFNALLRYEYEENGGTIPETLLIGQGTGTKEHLFGLEAIYAPDWRWEFYGKYAFRNSKTFIADDFVGSSNISLGQLRTTYRLNYHMDLVAEGRMIWQPSAGYTESGLLLETGYYLTPELRLAAGYVFGRADDEDFAGTRSAGGPYIGMTVKLNSLLDGFGQHSQPKLPAGVTKEKERRGTGRQGDSKIQRRAGSRKRKKKIQQQRDRKTSRPQGNKTERLEDD